MNNTSVVLFHRSPVMAQHDNKVRHLSAGDCDVQVC